MNPKRIAVDQLELPGLLPPRPSPRRKAVQRPARGRGWFLPPPYVHLEPGPGYAAPAASVSLEDAKRERAKAQWFWHCRQPIVGSVGERYLRETIGYGGAIPATIGFLPERDRYPPALIAALGMRTEPEPGQIAIADNAVMGSSSSSSSPTAQVWPTSTLPASSSAAGRPARRSSSRRPMICSGWRSAPRSKTRSRSTPPPALAHGRRAARHAWRRSPMWCPATPTL